MRSPLSGSSSSDLMSVLGTPPPPPPRGKKKKKQEKHRRRKKEKYRQPISDSPMTYQRLDFRQFSNLRELARAAGQGKGSGGVGGGGGGYGSLYSQMFYDAMDDDYDANRYYSVAQRQRDERQQYRYLPDCFSDEEDRIGGNNHNNHNINNEAELKTKRCCRCLFGTQLLANLQRMALERLRSPLLFASEILIPVFFVVVAVLLGVALETHRQDEAQHMSYDKPEVLPLMPQPQSQFMCAFNDPSADASTLAKPLVPGLAPCDLSGFDGYECDGDDGALPVRGLCHVANISGRDVALSYFVRTIGNPSYVADLDTIVTYQWLARKSIREEQDARHASLMTAGLAITPWEAAVLRSGDVLFSPDSEDTRKLVAHLNKSTATFAHIYGGTFSSVEDARNFAASGATPIWAIIDVRSLSAESFDVDIQVNRTAVPPLGVDLTGRYSGGFQPGSAELYLTSGVLSLQKSIYEYYTRAVLSATAFVGTKGNVVPYVMTMGTIPFQQCQMIYWMGPVVSFMVVLGFLYPVTMVAKHVVLEKELRLEEAMLIMGMGKGPRVLSSIIFYSLQFLFTTAVVSFILKLGFLSQSRYHIIFLFFFIFGLSCISLGVFFASFFSRSHLVFLITPIAYFIMLFPLFAMQNATGTLILALSWLPPTCCAGALNVMLRHEVEGGMREEHMMDPTDYPKFGILLLIMTADCVVYYILGLYLDAVLPKEFGTPKNPFFFIMDPIRALCSCCRGGGGSGERISSFVRDGRDESGVFEDSDPPNVSVEISGLRKVYKRHGGVLVAVDDVCLKFGDGGIAVLLGHNGAGKSTTINMLTGMTKPTAGDCYVYGHSVRHELAQVRHNIGYCPQHNILWPTLTCREHLEFYGKIKGMRGAALEDAVIGMLSEVDLLDKIDCKASALSGGMKRKLSVAIAFVGGGRLVLLDEPTAGMDVAARRYTWELLMRMSASRTIVLTTHFVDEADLLGDTVAIMSNGRLRCAGSSLFLKSRLGAGYRISITLGGIAGSSEQVQALVCSTVPSAELVSSRGNELLYQLPSSEADAFPRLMSQIEFNGAALGIRGYALSATTLEEVFLKVASDDQQHTLLGATDDDGGASMAEHQENVWRSPFLTGDWEISWRQFAASMKKRFHNARRDKKMLFFQIVCPIICVLLAMLFNLVSYADSGVHVMGDAGAYPIPTEVVLSRCDDVLGPHAQSYSDLGIMEDRKNYTSALDLNYYLIDSWYAHRNRPGRFTAVQCHDEVFHNMLKGANLSPTSLPSFEPVLILYNTSSSHEVAEGLYHFYSSMIMEAIPGHSKPKLSLRVLPATPTEKQIQGGVTAILISCMILVPFTFLPSNCIAWIVKERECKSRHLQKLSGLRFVPYWLSNFLFDWAAFLLTYLVVIIIFLIFKRDEYIGPDAAPALVVLMLLYSTSSISLAYLLSYTFSSAATAQTTTMIAGFITGFLCVIAVFLLDMVMTTRKFAQYLRWPFRLFPTYCMGEGLINLATLEQDKLDNPSLWMWSMDVIGWPCVYMAIETPLFMIITLALDHPYLRQRKGMLAYDPDGPVEDLSGADSDVELERCEALAECESILRQKEEAAIYQELHSHGSLGQLFSDSGSMKSGFDGDGQTDDGGGGAVGAAVTVTNLRKVYPNGKVAVRDLSFTVWPGEVFGFLGTNGAGKTTSISILCQEKLPSSGRAFICGHDVVLNSAAALRSVGYCPQFDATLDLVTVEEHLYLFASLRALHPDAHDRVVHSVLHICNLVEYRHVQAGELSGGNRRKLSVALSLIGGPEVVFMDEPSAGMDPISRRGLWTSILAARQQCSIVLTTHHLEEVEALADCVAIMVDGHLRCIGTKTHLKNKFGTGFEMSVRIAPSENGGLEEADQRMRVENFVFEHFPEASLSDYRGGRFTFALPRDTLLSEVFLQLQSNKAWLGITDYCVSQTSIEQVFMQIIKEADEEG